MRFILKETCCCAHSAILSMCLHPIAPKLLNSTVSMVSLMNRLPLSGTKSNSDAVAVRLREQLRAITIDPETHGRFLNTLSLLEHVGSRKIMMARVVVHDGA